MAVGSVLLSVGTTRLDAELGLDPGGKSDLIPLFGPEGARAILSAIAGSMITVAGLTFSITMLTLQLASSQFGPRLLRSFMRDRGNQIVLGTFISTFLYCLLVLRTVKGVEGASFVPHLSVATGVLLAISSLAILIYFIHHTAHSIRLETLLAALAQEVREAIDRLYPEELGDSLDHQTSAPDLPDFSRARVVAARRSGYIQAIDSASLLESARRHDIVVEIAAAPGAFVTTGDTLMRFLRGATALNDARDTDAELPDEVISSLRNAVVIGDERTPDQDIEFSLRRIVEITQRSLSPGINDPTTALYCIDRLREAMTCLAARRAPSSVRLDSKGEPRVIARPVEFDTLARNTVAAVARYAAGDEDVLRSLIGAILGARSAAKSHCPRLGRLLMDLRSELEIATSSVDHRG